MAVEAPKKKPSSKGTPPATPAAALANPATTKPASDNYVALNFSVTSEFKRQYKLIAAMQDTPMTEILKESFELYKKAHGIA